MTAVAPPPIAATPAPGGAAASGQAKVTSARLLAVHVSLLLWGLFVSWLIDDPIVTLRATGVFAFFVYAWMAWVEATRTPLLLSPLSYYFVWMAMSLGLSALHFASLLSDGSSFSFGPKAIYADDLAVGYLIYLFGSVCLHAGIQLTRPFVRSGDEQPAFHSGFLVLWIVGTLVSAFLDRLSFLGALGGVFQMAPIAGLLAFVANRHVGKPRDLRFWFSLGAGTLVVLALNLGTGSKAYIMFSVFPAVLLFVKDGGLRRYLPVVAVVGSLFYLTLVAPVISASRTSDLLPGESKSDRIVRVYMQDDYGEGKGVGQQFETFLERIFEPIPVAFLYRETARTGEQWGETMDYLAYAFIPRLFWPDKPGVSRGGWFYAYIGAARNEKEATTSIAQTAAGELYWNFNLPGVMFGLGGIGALLGLLWRQTTAWPHRDPLRLLLYVSITLNMLDMSEAGSLIVGIAYRAILLCPVILLLDRLALRAREEARAS